MNDTGKSIITHVRIAEACAIDRVDESDIVDSINLLCSRKIVEIYIKAVKSLKKRNWVCQ